MLWQIASPLIPPATKQKLRVAKGSGGLKETFLEFCDESDLPVEYGGTLQMPGGFKENPMEVEYRNFVHDLNKRHGYLPPYDGTGKWPAGVEGPAGATVSATTDIRPTSPPISLALD